MVVRRRGWGEGLACAIASRSRPAYGRKKGWVMERVALAVRPSARL